MSRVTGFIEYLESHVGDMYVWGAQGQQVDSMSDPYAWIERRETSDVNYNRATYFMEKAEKRPLYAFDCSGLIVHYISDIKHWMKGDTNAQGLYRMCGENRGYAGKTPMCAGDLVFKYSESSKKMVHVGVYVDTMPDIPGVCVFMRDMSHVGVYVGDGYTIEAKGRDDGVCKRKLSDGSWTHWGRLALLQQEEEKEEVKARKIITLTTPMMRGDDIKALQTALNSLGYNAGDPDGIAGKNTIAAIRRFAQDYANAGETELPEVLQATVSVDGKIYVGALKK